MADGTISLLGRREALYALTSALSLPLFTTRAGAQAGGWNTFVATAREQALKLLLEERVTPEVYVRWLSARMLRAPAAPTGSLQPISWMNPSMSFRMASMGRPFAVTEWRMEPGAQQPCHDHPRGSVCTIILEGELKIENFDVIGGAESAAPLRLRRSRVETLFPGQTSILTPEENNLHRLTAGPLGARGVDFNTVHGAPSRFSYYRLSPMDDAGDLVSAEAYDPSAPNA